MVKCVCVCSVSARGLAGWFTGLLAKGGSSIDLTKIRHTHKHHIDIGRNVVSTYMWPLCGMWYVYVYIMYINLCFNLTMHTHTMCVCVCRRVLEYVGISLPWQRCSFGSLSNIDRILQGRLVIHNDVGCRCRRVRAEQLLGRRTGRVAVTGAARRGRIAANRTV